MNQFSMLLGVFRYEFRMQIRRYTLWMTFAVFTALIFILFNQGDNRLNVAIPRELAHYSLLQVVANWTFSVSTYLPLCIGALLADRLPRDRRTKVDELFTTLPASLDSRLLGKYLGTVLATVIPVFLIYIAGIAYIFTFSHNALTFLLALETFVVIVLPGILFVSAFSIAIPALLWVPLYQFLFICYWYWNTLWFHATIPNLGRTILAPIGLYIAYGFYNQAPLNSGGPHGDPGIHSTPLLATESLLALIGLAALVLFVLGRYLHWRQARQ